jgi:hypothetical protein
MNESLNYGFSPALAISMSQTLHKLWGYGI